jgi:Flp pilus assembly CpaE family ATPase
LWRANFDVHLDLLHTDLIMVCTIVDSGGAPMQDNSETAVPSTGRAASRPGLGTLAAVVASTVVAAKTSTELLSEVSFPEGAAAEKLPMSMLRFMTSNIDAASATSKGKGKGKGRGKRRKRDIPVVDFSV